MKKEDVTIKKSRFIDLQIALIAILCFGYWMFDVYANPIHQPKKIVDHKVYKIPDINDAFIGPIVVETNVKKVITVENTSQPQRKVIPKIEPKIQPKIQPKTLKNPVIDESNKALEKDKLADKNPLENGANTVTNTTRVIQSKTTRNTNSAKTNLANTNATTFSELAVDRLPVHPDCMRFSSNEAIKSCFESRIQKLVKRRFNNEIGSELGLDGIQRINVYFEIDTQGNITNIKARAKGNHKALEKEARRVAKMLPKMAPALKNGKAVSMSYTLPITLDVR